MKKIPVLPSLLTSGNIICGFASVSFAARGIWMHKLAADDVEGYARQAVGSFDTAAWFILLAMVFDALDGKIARLLKSTSTFGAELDSLADVVTFGFAPAFLVKAMMPANFPPRIGWIMSSLFLVCAALRLARFNMDTDDEEGAHEYFQGLPSPAAAGMIAVMVILHRDLVDTYGMEMRPIIPTMLPLVALALAALMISKVPYLHVAIWLFKDHRPAQFFSLLIFVIVFLLLTKPYSFSLLLGLYCLSGLVAGLGVPDALRKRFPPEGIGDGDDLAG